MQKALVLSNKQIVEAFLWSISACHIILLSVIECACIGSSHLITLVTQPPAQRCRRPDNDPNPTTKTRGDPSSYSYCVVTDISYLITPVLQLLSYAFK